MVLWHRGQFGSLDRALRRERLWHRFGSGSPSLQSRRKRARFGVAEFSRSCCGRVVVRQTFEYFEATARRVGNRSPSANAPNEKCTAPLSRSWSSCCRGALVGLVFEHRFDLLAQFRRILMPVCGDCMPDCRVEHLLLCSGDFERAIFLTRIISAIDRFSFRRHCSLWSAGLTPVYTLAISPFGLTMKVFRAASLLPL